VFPTRGWGLGSGEWGTRGQFNSKFKIQNSKFKIQNSKFKIQNSKFKIQNSKFKIQNSKFIPTPHTSHTPHTLLPTPYSLLPKSKLLSEVAGKYNFH
jgi:hypothetical protein